MIRSHTSAPFWSPFAHGLDHLARQRRGVLTVKLNLKLNPLMRRAMDVEAGDGHAPNMRSRPAQRKAPPVRAGPADEAGRLIVGGEVRPRETMVAPAVRCRHHVKEGPRREGGAR